MKLAARMVEKPWGVEHLPAPFVTPAGERIGEIWFEPPAELDALLVKYIFTSEKLSVQVHPGDADAPSGARGKEECWLVIGAEPGAMLGIGFREKVTPEEIRAGALDGSIEAMLAWHVVAPGDFVYIPAGTVHAIGAGISLIEIQQNSDITYRLYDYGRPRELHLDAAIRVASSMPHDPALRRKLAPRGNLRLADGPLFQLSRVEGMPDAGVAAHYAGAPLLAVPLGDGVCVAGEAVGPGECALAHDSAALEIAAGSQCLLVQPCR